MSPIERAAAHYSQQRGASAVLPRLLDIVELAEHLGVTERHVRRLVAERRIPFVKWGHLVRFDPNEIVVWLDHSRVPPGDDVTWRE